MSLLTWIFVVEGFVNVQHVRRSVLHSTSTEAAYEPGAQLTDTYSRNPFVEDKDGDEDFSSAPISSTSVDTGLAMTAAVWNRIAILTGASEDAIAANRCSKAGANIPWWLLARSALQSERARRRLQKNVRVALHHFFRDTGILRSVMDFLVTIGAPALALEHDDVVPRFLRLTKECISVSYGSHKMQAIDMFFPQSNKENPRGLVYFVHGGAWGSGLPWMYRLVAQSFLDNGMAVAIVGYRTFPDCDIKGQVKDLETAAAELSRQFPKLCLQETKLGVTVIGHSSGAHIAMQMIVNRLYKELDQARLNKGTHDNMHRATASGEMRIDNFIGMSAPYEISGHYQFETLRGLEELSPMKAACGNNKETLSDFSPVLQLSKKLSKCSQHERRRVAEEAPRIAIVHGVDDDTVPFTASRQAAKLLRLAGINNCDEMYLSEMGHSETVMELMFGGRTQDAVHQWLEQPLTSIVSD